MTTGKKALVLVTVLLVLLTTVTGCGSQGGDADSGNKDSTEVIELRLGTKMTADSPEGLAFQKFADLANERAEGRLNVTVYPSEQLGSGTTQIDNVILGSQDLYADGSTYLASFNKDYSISSVPFLFRDDEHYHKFCTSELGQQMNETLMENGIRIINDKRNFVRGPYRVLVSTVPIKSLSDIQGMKIRSFESPVYGACWANLGANPIVVAYTETYLALKQNVVKGAVLPISNLYSMKWTEVGKYVSRIDEFPQDIVIVMNNKKFESLPEDLQQILVDAANDAGDYGTELAHKSAEEDTERIKEEHGAEFITLDTAEWQEKMKPYFYELEKKGLVSEGMIDKVLAIE